MDLVKIGFVVSANGLKDANTEVDKLLNRVDKIGSGSKKNASDFENSQKRIKDSSKSTTNEIDKTTKALERQRLIGDYLAKGLNRTTATAIANFKQLGGTTSQVNALMTSLANNKGIVQSQKDTAKLTREQGAQAKALERQRIIGEYLGKGLDKTTASAIASFRQLGGTIAQVNTLMSSLASNKGLVQAQKDAAKLTREQGAQAKAVQTNLANFKQLKAGVIDTNTVFTLLGNNHSLNKTNKQTKAVNDSLNKMRLSLDFVGKGFSASEQAQLRQLKVNGASNAELEKAIELIKKKKQAEVLADYQNQKASLSREWLSAYDKEIAARVAKEKEAVAKIQQIRDDHEAKSKKSLGGGILDSIDRQNKGLADMAKHYSNIEAQQKKAVDEQVKAQKAIALEQTKAKYINEGYGKTDAGRLARLEVSGADITTLNNYKDAIKATTKATQALNPVVQEATVRHNNFLGQIKGIAAYALLSTVIYGAMTATFGLVAATIKMADEYTSTQQRLKLYIKDSQTLGEVNTFLAKSAIQNNVGLRENAALYAKLAPAMQRIGANTAATNVVVDAFGKSLRIGGATATEAAAATIQFAQAMASGKLAGDEFRSISEASPRFLKAIADGSGIAAEKLKEMSSAGALTTEVIARALVKEYHNLTKESESLGYTLEQGTNALKTGFMSLIGEFNEGAEITKYLGSLMAGMGVDMIDSAESARQSGESFKAWATGNAENIDTLVEAFKLLAITVVSKYVASMVVAGAISLKTAYSLNVASLGATAVQRAFGLAAIAATRLGGALSALATPKNLFTLGLTVVGVATSYLLMRDNAAEATQKLAEQSKYVDITTEAYQRLNKEQQLNARSSIVNDLNDTNKKLDEQASAVENVLKSYAMSRQFSGLGLDKGTKEIINGVTKGVLSYDTALRMLSENSNVPKRIVEAFKKERDIYNETAKNATKFADAAKVVGYNTELAGNKAQNATPLIKGFSDQASELGDKAEIAGGKVRKFYQDLQAGTQKNILAFDLSNKLNISPSTSNKVAEELHNRAAQEEGIKNSELINQNQKLVKLKADLIAQNARVIKGAKSSEELDQLKANTAEVLKQQRIYDNMRKSKPYVKVNPLSLLTPEETKIIKDYDASTSLSSNQTKAEKKLNKEKKDELRDLEKFNKELLEISTYQKMLEQVSDLDVARIASQKEYIDIYKDNLSVAKQLADMQDSSKQAEARLELEKSLRTEEEAHDRILELMRQGADYETAKSLAAAKFTGDMRGRQAAELSLTNALYNQQASLGDQVAQQENINKYLKEGLGIEEATLRTTLSRIAALGNSKNDHEKMRKNYETALQYLRVAKATSDSQVKINSLNREADLLTTSMAFSYTAASLAAAKLSASTQGLLYSQAEIQLTKQNEVDLIAEQYEISLKISSLLSQDSEVMRDIKSQYPTILEVDAQRLETARKLLEITEAYSAKQQEQKKNPFGDFSNVNFDVFGDIGNPFKEALDGLNAFISGNTKLTESLSIVAERIASLKSQKFLLQKLGNTDAANALTKQIKGQVKLEKDLQKQKEETNDIAYGQGLKFAKSFFKENSKGYKVVSALEMALQAKKIAFTLWEKKDAAMKLASELAGYAKSAAAFVASTLSKISVEGVLNTVKGVGAIIQQGTGGDVYSAIPRMAAMAAVVAALGVAISGAVSGSSGSFAPTNDGTGTVFGDSEAKSASIANSIDLLSENSDLMLPLTSAMLASLRNIESSIGGVTNLILRQATGGKGFNVSEGFQQDKLGSLVGNGGSLALGVGLGVLTGGIGLLLGTALGKALGGLFGTKTTVKGQGLFGGAQSLSNIMSNGFDLQEYVDVQTKKKTLGVTTSTKNSTQYASASKELENQFGLIFTGFYDSIVSASGALSANTEEVKKKLQDAIINIGKIDLKGLNGEQIQERLEAVFGAAADSLAQQGFAGLDDFQKVGEGYYETLMRVASSVEQASYYTDKLNVKAIKYTDILNKQGDVAAEIIRQSVLLVEGNKNIKGGFYDLVNTFNGTAEELTSFIFQLRDLQDQLIMTGKNADYLTSSMILGAGGLDKLSSGFDAYFEMLSPAEQAAELTRRLTKEFAIFGKELPSDVKAFRNLVNGLDISTEAGQKLYGQIIALAPEFNDLQDALDSANSEVNALVQSLRDLAEQARGARGETDQTRNLASIRSEFGRVSNLAMQGDIAAANRLVELGKDLMGVSKTYATSNEDYTRDLALIQRAATVAADLQANGLGTTVTPTLTTTAGAVTTPTIATTNASMTTEMKTMREELNAGLFAIAKFVQNIDSRTDRWDDGNRVMVGVLPEVGDNPQPVAVV